VEPPQNATKYWGTIYGTSGEKIGTAFVGEDEDASVVVPRLTKTFPSDMQPKKKRVFIGEVQSSWGLSGYTVKDLVNGSQFSNGKDAAEARDRSPTRMYIGKKPPRFIGPPVLAVDTVLGQPHSSPGSNLSDLTPASNRYPADWPEPAVGESAHFGYNLTPVVAYKEEVDDMVLPLQLNLSPGKIERAIALGLGAVQLSNE